MKAIIFLRYFFYLGFNWNFRIATKIIIQEIKGEKKYGIETTGADELNNLSNNGIDTSHATIYMPISYTLLEALFMQLKANPAKHLLDIGCGKGRILCVAAHQGFKQITGIDFSKQLCLEAEGNLKNTTQKYPDLKYSVITKDAMNYEIPSNVDCIFLFNPFDVVVMGAVLYNIMESAQDFSRDITVVYANPVYLDLFIEEGFEEIFHTKEMKYLEAVILKLPALT